MNCRFLVLIFCLISQYAFAVSGSHLEEIKSKFPFGLLSDDYGILTKDDLAYNACEATAEPFTPTFHVYQHWQCFESKSISFDCDSNGTADKYEGVMGLIIVKVSTQTIQHEYIERRIWPIKDCKNFIKDAALLLKGSHHACLSGSFVDSETGKSGNKSMNWILERIKTKKGCEGHGCEFTKKFKRDHCPNLKL